MGENMNFPDDPLDFIKEYSFKDKLGIYTNGSMLVPIFRVKQMVEHYYMTGNKCEFCSGFNTIEPKLKEINMYECTKDNGQKSYCLDIERPDGYIPEPWRNKRLQINFCPICGRKLVN